MHVRELLARLSCTKEGVDVKKETGNEPDSAFCEAEITFHGAEEIKVEGKAPLNKLESR